MKIIVTGSSGYVGSFLVPLLRVRHQVIGIDLNPSPNTDLVSPIAESEFLKLLSYDDSYIVVNLAACRFDHGVSAISYFESNCRDHEKFLAHLDGYKVKRFIHLSSVAALDGAKIEFNSGLNCDDAYRSTKYLQSKIINGWCQKNGIHLVELLPSAIYDDHARSDTNIGKLQSLARLVPFIPKIQNKKSVTYLPRLVNFVDHIIEDDSYSGSYLAFESPVKTVTEIIKENIDANKLILPVPGLLQILFFMSTIFMIINKMTGLDLKLYPGRVKKLFSDTSYSNSNIDRHSYQSFERRL